MAISVEYSLKKLQHAVAEMYAERGYSADLKLLALGVNEEAGEVAGAVLNMSPDFKQKPGRASDTLAHEWKDLLVYMLALATAASLDLDAIGLEICQSAPPPPPPSPFRGTRKLTPAANEP